MLPSTIFFVYSLFATEFSLDITYDHCESTVVWIYSGVKTPFAFISFKAAYSKYALPHDVFWQPPIKK